MFYCFIDFWAEVLRGLPDSETVLPPATCEEVHAARKRLRPGRSPGADGIPAEVLRSLSSLLVPMTLIFNVMLRTASYPQSLGIALIRSLLKPGKPVDKVTSLRGIRLLCSAGAWFGQLLDRRTRGLWQAGKQQFGFKQNVGCMEAVAVLLALISSRTTQKKRLFILWIDLRTAFPSLNRGILLRRLFTCGMGIGYCRLVQAIFDATRSVVCIGTLIGQQFQEVLGVREGAVESPHQFNAYIDTLHERLVEEHPRLCKLFGVIIAVLLYADDAALPADSIEDLALSALILEQFCNDNHLYISVPKSYITVFHHAEDNSVIYDGSAVFVDGQRVQVAIYGQELTAAREFKYLGVILESTGAVKCHLDARCAALGRAIGLLTSGLLRLPGGSHEFALYLWQTLVAPVATYGMELFAWSESDCANIRKVQLQGLRKVSFLGGRAPGDITRALAGVQCCTLEWRVRRVGLLLRLVNSPPDSLQHLALAAFRILGSPWLNAAVHDMQIVLPGIDLRLSTSPYGPIITSTYRWSDSGEWMSAQIRCLPRGEVGAVGRPTCLKDSPKQSEAIRRHIRGVTRKLRNTLHRQADSQIAYRVMQREAQDHYAKTATLALQIQHHGLPLHIALDWAGPTSHRAALAAFIGGDFFLARYSGNYFAKALLPSEPRHSSSLTALGTQASRVCLHCWHHLRALHEEDEAHVLFDCPAYQHQRRDFRKEITGACGAALTDHSSAMAKWVALLSSPQAPRLGGARQISGEIAPDQEKDAHCDDRDELQAD